MPITHHRSAAGGPKVARRSALLLLSGLLSIAALPAATLAQSAPIERAAIADPYAVIIAEASQRFGIPEGWIRAVMRVESHGEVRALSPAGAMGLMQIMPATWAELRIRHRLGGDPYDARDNILGGAAYLREMYDRYGSPGFLAAYNAGSGRYEEYLATGRALPAETRAYVAALAPFVGGEDLSGAIRVAVADPLSWTRAPLFVGQSERPSTADPEQPNRRSGDDLATAHVRDSSTTTPRSNGMFVARSGEEGPR
ncbi:lytic transglycosylase domain-containing protein [Xanthobacter autotrophicus]|uniref:lytic transglycosylase domain-containing protein n=1 Tax=Xanthobacter autotrophicus TaxID=280 RepID=UPI0024A79FD4|nr:lytic transglycosylase domain-containing protein [Xanthobacter autotrophicus]MDI4655005.1 lytic transglycosylase domain-containing protein [Xanthobacter autotrophicus]